MTQASCEVSIVVPVYRSEAILPHLVEQVLAAMRAAQLQDRFELVLVNDCSPDDSWRVIRELAARYPFVRGIGLARNFGQHNATMAGLNHAAGEIIVVMDDDLQHPPSSIITLVDTIRAGRDVCYTQYMHRQHASWKKWGSWFNDRIASFLLKKPKGLYLSSYKAMHARVAAEIIRYDGPYAYVDGLILDVTRDIAVVPIEHQARLVGAGNYNLRRSVSLWLKMATSFSIVPLRVASLAGMLLAAISIVSMILIVIGKYLHPEVQTGWTSLMTIVLFMGSLQLLCLGLLGEYLGRAYLKINRKPQFSIKERIGL